MIEIQHCRSAPVDAAASDDGNIVVDFGSGTYAVVGRAPQFEGDTQARHKNHFATCPNAPFHHKVAAK